MHQEDEWDNLEIPQEKKDPVPVKPVTKKKPEERAKKINLRFTKCCATCEYMSYIGSRNYSWCHFPARTLPKETIIKAAGDGIPAIMENLGYNRTLVGLICDNWESAPCRNFNRSEKNLNFGPLALPGDSKDGIIKDRLSATNTRKVK